MKIKKIRSKNGFIVYFRDLRRSIEVNKTGLIILESFFSENKEIEEVIDILIKGQEIDRQKIKSDIVQFLEEIESDLKLVNSSQFDSNALDFPIGAEIEITLDCNLRCRHCLQSHPKEYMPLEYFKFIIDELVDKGLCEVNIIGGEPLAHPNIIEIVEYCSFKDLAINVVSNGTLFSKELINRFEKIDGIGFLISMDGNQETHDFLRGRGVYNIAIKNINELLDRGIPVELLFTLNSRNLTSINEMLELSCELGIAINFNLFKPFKNGHDTLVIDPDKYFEAIIYLYNKRNEGYNVGISNASITSFLSGANVRDECRATKSGIVINVHGKIITCPSLVESGYYSEESLPSFDKNFISTWKYHNQTTEFLKNGFKECQARAYIFSGCVSCKDPYGFKAFRKHLELTNQ